MELGYFAPKEREYVLTNMYPVRPQKNFLFNQQIISSLDQFGFGLSNAFTSNGFRPLVFDERLIYIKDEDSKEYYAANRNYDQLPFDVFECHVGCGYQRIISDYQGLRCEYTILIPREDLVELGHVKITNHSSQTKSLSIYSMIRPHINVTWHTPYTKTQFDHGFNGVYFSHEGFHLKEKFVHSFYKSDSEIVSFELNQRFFKGTYQDFAHPIGLQQNQLGSRLISFEEHLLAVLQFKIKLKPGEEKSINLAYGLSDSYANLEKLAQKYGNEAQYKLEMEKLVLEQEQLEKSCMVQTADTYLNVQVNTWLKRQISLGKSWGRVYGKGFRDVLQDISAFVSFDPSTARERILNTLRYFKTDGNTIRQFDPIFDEPYRDGAAWVPQTLLIYIKETNDIGILDEIVGYYDSDEKDSVFSHMVRGLRFLFEGRGQHGLCLWGGGDWNDSMNNCGTQGQGESVWLSFATVKAVNEFVELVRYAKPQYDVSSFVAKKDDLVAQILQYGFDQHHYLYGYNDYNEKVGSRDFPDYGNLYLNPQTWAVLAQCFTKEESIHLMNQVERHLKCDYGYKLVDQAFQIGTDKIGRVSYFAPGCFENGSVYLHANTFKIAADLLLGRHEEAYETLKMIRYDNPKNPNNGMEPYAVSNMLLGPEMTTLKGFAPQSWITGSAGWLYRDIVELMFGVCPGFSGLELHPCLPNALPEVTVTRSYRKATYHIQIRKTGETKLLVNGLEVSGNTVPIGKEGSVHTVIYTY